MHAEMVWQNPHASAPLRYGLDVTCNVPDDVILRNCLTNARKVRHWLKSQPAHDRVLAICGSGPSINDDVATIAAMQATGAEVWALNNCANFLRAHGILADAQVVMDALPETLRAVGPAKAHYFASQVDPSLFDAVPDAVLWHATLGDTLIDQQDGFPEHDDDYCLIGSAVSVGNTAMVLAFALGYRTIHLFGYDSSNKGEASHALHQPWNDGEPMTVITFRDKSYTCSLTMSLQAEAFPMRARVLEREGCAIVVHGYGLLPDRWNAEWSEAEKYTEMWQRPEYRASAPGEECAQIFIDWAQPQGSVIDFGCGTGRGAIKLHQHGLDVTCMDFTDNSRDDAAMSLPFVRHDLTQPISLRADYGFCTDVLEHLPPEWVRSVIRNIMAAAPCVFFQISTVPDTLGGLLGVELHLTVRRHEWWLNLFTTLGFTVQRHEDRGQASLFLILDRTTT